MKELTDDGAYEKLNSNYSELLLDYVLLDPEGAYQGMSSHKEAVAEAIRCLGKRSRVGNYYDPGAFTLDESKMSCKKVAVDDFFYEGNNGYWLSPEEVPCKEPADKMNYWYAFFEQPYRVPYTVEDFRTINHMLFPLSFQGLEIYSWNDDFSDYFDVGKDWWGTAMWSIYDRAMGRFVIIGASLSD